MSMVDEPLEYIKTVCSCLSANFPIYFFIQQAHVTISDAIAVVDKTTSRGQAKKILLDRLQGKTIRVLTPSTKTAASQEKMVYIHHWLNETMPKDIGNLSYFVESVLYLTTEEIADHKKYLCSILLDFFQQFYETAKSTVASNFRKAICRIDEALFLENNP